MLKHSFSDFSYAVNFESEKKGKKEILVCYIYNGVEVLKKIYIPEGPGISYIFEAKKIIDQEMRDGSLAVYSHKFIAKNRRKRIQPKKVVAAVNAGKPATSVAPVASTQTPAPKGGMGKWIAITAVVAILVAAGSALITYFATKSNQPEPTPVIDGYDVVFDKSDSRVGYDGEATVKAKDAYTCKIFVKQDQANFEINKDNFVVYAGQSQLMIGTDYTLSYYEESSSNGLELAIEKNKINGTVFISARSIERSSLDDLSFYIDEADSKAVITGLNLKAGQNRSDITEITIPDSVTDENGDQHEVKKIEIDTDDPESEYVDGDGLLTGCSSLRKLTIPFVGLDKDLDINIGTETDGGSVTTNHFFGALFGNNFFKNAETATYQDYWYWKYDEEKLDYVYTHVLIDFAIPNTLNEINITHYNNVKYNSGAESKSIALGAFSNCSYLTDVSIADYSPANASIDKLAFSGCRALRTFNYIDVNNINATPTLTVGEEAFNSCGVLMSFDFTAVTNIKENAFKDCAGMKSVYLPKEVVNIAPGAFEGYYGLVKCEPTEKPNTWLDGWVDQLAPVVYGLEKEEAEPIVSDDGTYSCLITKYKDKQTEEVTPAIYIVQYFGDYNDEPIDVPSEITIRGESLPVRYIGSESFMDFNLTPSIKVGSDNLISVGPEAFKKCFALENIEFTLEQNAESKLETIGANAFENCYKLVHIDGLSSSIESIGNYAFYNCPKLLGSSSDNKLTLSGVTSVGVSSFECDLEKADPDTGVALTSITLYNSGDKGVVFGNNAFKNCNNLSTITYKAVADGKGEYTIPDYCFYGTAIKEIKVPQCTTTIGTAAYAYCQSALSINFENNSKVVTIGDSAFLRCKNINTDVKLPEGLSSLGVNAFQDCHKLASIECLGNKLINIPDSVCYGDTALNYFKYPAGTPIETIGAYAFANDQNMDYLGTTNNTMPTSLKSIGDRAFVNCVSIGRSSTTNDDFCIPKGNDSERELYIGEEVFLGWYNRYTDSSDPQTVRVDKKWYTNDTSTKKVITWGEGCTWNLDNTISLLDGWYLDYPQPGDGHWYLNVDQVTLN